MPDWLPRGKFHDWPQDAVDLPAEKVKELYKGGFAGARADPAALDLFRAVQQYPDGEAAAHQFGLAETGAGKLVIPFVHVLEMFPNCWPGAQGQGRGDCVSWSTRNAALMTMVCDIVAGTADQVSGKPEQKPEVPAEGVADGVLSTESFYWWRGYNGDGWSCGAAANVATKTSGLFVRKDYPELGVNLTRYSSSLAGKWGSRPPGAEVKAVGGQHLVHQATELSTPEASRDYLFNGYGLTTCGGEGYSDRRNEDGVSDRQGSWSHAYARIGFDDRDVTKQKYGGPLVLELNSWARWNSGPRDILQSAALVPPAKKALWVQSGIVNATTGNIMIPEGAWWSKWAYAKSREVIAFSGVNGWPRKQIDNLLI
jgi:hypothetical protein